MAKRPIFIPKNNGNLMVVAMPIEFTWHPGMSKTQKQKSIRSLHDAAKKGRGIENILEISENFEILKIFEKKIDFRDFQDFRKFLIFWIFF